MSVIPRIVAFKAELLRPFLFLLCAASWLEVQAPRRHTEEAEIQFKGPSGSKLLLSSLPGTNVESIQLLMLLLGLMFLSKDAFAGSN